jgi:hypothetical protein
VTRRLPALKLNNWRRQYSGINTHATRELEELREQNGEVKRLLAETTELEKYALREVARGEIRTQPQTPCGRHARERDGDVESPGLQGSWAGSPHLCMDTDR